jgi:mannose-6-phosphate isomerase
LCGFQPLPAIAENLKNTPELAALIPPAIVEAFTSISSTPSPTSPEAKLALKNVFAALMTAEEAEYKKQLELLVQRYQSSTSSSPEGSIEELVLRLNSQFPGDIGIFCAFMLNHVALQPGEAIFLGAGEPHAYVSGGKSLFFSCSYISHRL